jgi:hypothetical protein
MGGVRAGVEGVRDEDMPGGARTTMNRPKRVPLSPEFL